jgi:toxin CptA
MSNSQRWCESSVPCSLEWRRSFWAVVALLGMTILAVCSVLMSGLSGVLRGLLIPFCCFYGIGLILSEWRRAPRRLVLGSGSVPAMLDGVPLRTMHLYERGPWVCVRARDMDGRRHCLVWWPDTLSPARRRELRLAVNAQTASRQGL